MPPGGSRRRAVPGREAPGREAPARACASPGAGEYVPHPDVRSLPGFRRQATRALTTAARTAGNPSGSRPSRSPTLTVPVEIAPHTGQSRPDVPCEIPLNLTPFHVDGPAVSADTDRSIQARHFTRVDI